MAQACHVGRCLGSAWAATGWQLPQTPWTCRTCFLSYPRSGARSAVSSPPSCPRARPWQPLLPDVSPRCGAQEKSHEEDSSVFVTSDARNEVSSSDTDRHLEPTSFYPTSTRGVDCVSRTGLPPHSVRPTCAPLHPAHDNHGTAGSP
jgi:hypothetical protein